MTKLHTCRTPSTFFMRDVTYEEWNCADCGQKWLWEKTGFSGGYGWHIIIGQAQR